MDLNLNDSGQDEKNPYKNQANLLVLEAKKKLSRSFIGALFGWPPKIEEARECYNKAANLFKIAKCWKEAGDAFLEAASLGIQSESFHDAASSFTDAANCFKKFNNKEAITSYLRAIEIYTDMGKFTMAAKYHVHIAETLEKDPSTLEQAIQHYEQAADYYMGEESTALANKYILKVAHYSAIEEKYDKAIKIYENVSRGAIANPLLKYSAKEYLFKAGLCHLCLDVLDALHALQRYVTNHPIFQESRECKFLGAIIRHFEEENVDEFTACVRDYDAISKLDDWHINILLRIKRKIGGYTDLR